MARRISIAAVVIALGATARAQDAPPGDAVQAHVDRAEQHFTAGRYREAATELEAAYAIDSRPKLLVGWAQAERLGGNCPRAIELYRKFLDTSPPADQAAQVWRFLGRCEEVVAQSEQAPAACPPSPPPPAAPAPPEPAREPGILPIALIVGGAASIVAGLGLVVAAQVDDAAAEQEASHQAFVSRIETAETEERIGWVTVSVGAVLAAGGVVTAIVWRSDF